MDKTLLNRICQKVYNQFPFIEGIRPTISEQKSDRYLLIFSSSTKTPDGRTIDQKVRVVVTPNGEIIKSSVSK